MHDIETELHVKLHHPVIECTHARVTLVEHTDYVISLIAVDFKAVMCGENPLMVFQPHLTSENVHVVAKVATKIPLANGGHLQASNIFRTFGEKLFWESNKEKSVAKVIS